MENDAILPYQQKFIDLVAIFASEPESSGKLFSNSNFKSDVQCRCGWKLTITNLNHRKVYYETKRHYEGKLSTVSATSKKYRHQHQQHILYGFYLKNEQILVLKKTKTILNWTVPKRHLSPSEVHKT